MALLKTKDSKEVIVAVDGSGGDRGMMHIAGAVNFAQTMYPNFKALVFGPAVLHDELKRSRIDWNRCEFVETYQVIPQDSQVNDVLERYTRSSMYQAVLALQEGRAQSMVSAGGTGPLVVLSRHLLGTMDNLRPALCARMPAGPGRYSLMLDLGANAQCSAQDLCDFARLGDAAAKLYFGVGTPRLAILNVGTEELKGSHVVQEAKAQLEADHSLNFTGFIEADRIFTGDADVIITDGFSGNIALKSAEGVYRIFSNAPGIKRFFAKMGKPDWLLPWQYNGSLLLGVNGNVVKSHGNAGKEAFAVAMVEAVKAAQSDLAAAMQDNLALLKQS